MIEYEILKDIENEQFKDTCQESFCTELPTKRLIIVTGGIKFNVFLCESHANQIKSCLDQSK